MSKAKMLQAAAAAAPFSRAITYTGIGKHLQNCMKSPINKQTAVEEDGAIAKIRPSSKVFLSQTVQG